MIYLYTGTPGSGKSFHTAQDIVYRTTRKKYNKVIGNFHVTIANQANYIYRDTMEMTPEFFMRYARENHEQMKENQTLVIIDEAQLIFNSRDWNSANNSRMKWIEFFSQHRKFGFTIILVAQYDRMIDKQIRSLIEYEVAHLKIQNYFRLLPICAFMCITRWYGQKLKVASEVLFYRKKIGAIYNTYTVFDGVGTRAPQPVKTGAVLKAE